MITMDAISSTTLLSIPKDNFDNAQVIGIDEGQFFNDICEFSEMMANKGIIIIISALDGTFEKPFMNIINLIPLCRAVVKLSAVCMECHGDAALKRLGNEKEVSISGIDKYIAVY